MNHPFLQRWAWTLPLFVGIIVIAITLPAYFQDDDFSIYWWLLYDSPSPIHWFEVWDMGLWRPFHLMIYWFEARLFGSEPIFYRLFHGLLYLLSIGLFLRLCTVITNSRQTALVASLLFAASFSHWQAIYWICASSEILVGLFGLIFFLSLVSLSNSTTKWAVFMAIGSHLAALLVKENAVALLPIACFYCWMSPVHRPLFKKKSLLWGLALPWFLSLTWHAWLASQGQAVQTGIFSPTGLHLLDNFGAFLAQLTLPGYSRPTLFAVWTVLAAFSGLLVWAGIQKKWLVFWAGAWTWISIIPYIGIDIPNYYPSRYLYFPSMGFALFAAMMLKPLWSISRQAWVWTSLALAVWVVFNLSLYQLHPDVHFFQRHDALHRRVVQELRLYSMPAIDHLAVTGLDLPLTQETMPDLLRYLIALNERPPQTIWTQPPWPEQPSLILHWDGKKFLPVIQ